MKTKEKDCNIIKMMMNKKSIHISVVIKNNSIIKFSIKTYLITKYYKQ